MTSVATELIVIAIGTFLGALVAEIVLVAAWYKLEKPTSRADVRERVSRILGAEKPAGFVPEPTEAELRDLENPEWADFKKKVGA